MSRAGRAVATALAAALVSAGCVAADQETASFEGADDTDRALPSVTDAATSEPPATTGPGDDEPPSSTTTESTVPLDPLQGLAAELVADGFDQPVVVTSAPGSDDLFVVEREGIVRVVSDGTVAEQPFIDLRDQLLSNSIEQGLLGLAFHPDYADNRTFYAYWTDPDGDSRLARFLVADTGPGGTPTADPDSLEVVLEVDQPAERHNAGMLQFGPDGLLYLALGDGGSGGSTAQDTTNPLGSILRLDVDGGDPYAIPDGNPFGDEIWVYGLRNPWRFSIDEPSGMVYIGDVGQERYEEIDVVALDDGAGTNFGWVEKEGTECFRSGCATDGLTDPVLQYSHDEGCSVTGGLVYRGPAIPEFVGHYFYADWCGGLVRSFRLSGQGQVTDQFDWTDDLAALGQVTSFGVDHEGELLAVNWAGELYRIVAVR
jgi:glucose/arabinose dehydrogenase